jgi:hypothetical protein
LVFNCRLKITILGEEQLDALRHMRTLEGRVLFTARILFQKGRAIGLWLDGPQESLMLDQLRRPGECGRSRERGALRDR